MKRRSDPMGPETVLRQAEDQVSTQLIGSAVILHLGRGHYFTLNETGAHLWELLEEGERTVQELRATLVARYDLDVDQASADLQSFLDDMREAGLVELRSGS